LCFVSGTSRVKIAIDFAWRRWRLSSPYFIFISGNRPRISKLFSSYRPRYLVTSFRIIVPAFIWSSLVLFRCQKSRFHF
jgi:hypothetical protein